MSIVEGLGAHTRARVYSEVVEEIRVALDMRLNGMWKDHPIRGVRVAYLGLGTLGHLPFGSH
jgi:hypothetical protein